MKSNAKANLDEYNKYKRQPKESQPANPLINFTNFNTKIIEEINIARAAPTEYAAKLERISTKFITKFKVKINDTEMNVREGVAIFDEAIQFLLNMTPLQPLEEVEGLGKSADELLSVLIIQEGVNMKELEPSIYELEKRLDHYGVFFGEFCELIDYGSADPELVVLNFVLCDGDDSRKARKILFNPLLRYIGISSGILPSERTCSILNFVQYFYRPGEEIPENMLNRYTYQPNMSERVMNLRQQSCEVYLDKKEQYKEHFEMTLLLEEDKPSKKVKKVKEIKKKIKDKITGKEIMIVKKIITYEDGEEEVQTYTL